MRKNVHLHAVSVSELWKNYRRRNSGFSSVCTRTMLRYCVVRSISETVRMSAPSGSSRVHSACLSNDILYILFTPSTTPLLDEPRPPNVSWKALPRHAWLRDILSSPKFPVGGMVVSINLLTFRLRIKICLLRCTYFEPLCYCLLRCIRHWYDSKQ